MDFSTWPSLGGRLYRELAPPLAELLASAPPEIADYALPVPSNRASVLSQQLQARLADAHIWYSGSGYLNIRWEPEAFQEKLELLLELVPPSPTHDRGELTRPVVLGATLGRLGEEPPSVVGPVLLESARRADLVARWGQAGLRYQLHRERPDRALNLSLDRDPYGAVEYACQRVRRLRQTAGHEPEPRKLAPQLLPLVRLLDRFGLVLLKTTSRRAPHLLTKYAENLAEVFHRFYRSARIMDPARPDRFAVALAVGVVLDCSCHLIGVDPSERV